MQTQPTQLMAQIRVQATFECLDADGRVIATIPVDETGTVPLIDLIKQQEPGDGADH